MKRIALLFMILMAIISLTSLFFFMIEPTLIDKGGILSSSEGKQDLKGLFSGSKAKGFDWSNGKCTGNKTTVQLIASPMSPDNIEVILPYGTIDPDSGHVTPIDHQYYYPKNRKLGPDLYDIFAPADGYIVTIAKRNQFVSEEGGMNPVPDYYIVMEHSCSFWTYFDLATSLAPEIQEQVGELPDDEVFVSREVRIPIKAGQKLGKIGLRTLDFGVYDAETNLPGFLVPEHYDGEPWKIHTVDPYDFFIEPIRSQLIAKTVRKAEPVAGKIDYDIDGRLSGNWFVEGSGGFPVEYEDKNWRNHLAIFPDAYDPTQIIFSHGNIDGRAKAYGIKKENIDPATIDPATVGVETGPVKYELINFEYFIKGTDTLWERSTHAEEVVSKPNADWVEGVALVQLIGSRRLKVEVFMGTTADKLYNFTDKAVLYER